MVTGDGAVEIAHSGSLSPCPVTVQTTRDPAGTSPTSVTWSNPATLAALASSTNTPTCRASSRYADRISRSVTDWITPPDSSRASSAFVHEAGLPMRIAVAMVCGPGTPAPLTIGAAPDAWNPYIFGRCVALPASTSSVYPIQYAVMLPALPTGRQWMSGASPSASTISNEAVFWPCSRSGFTELTSATGKSWDSLEASPRQSSKLPLTWSSRAPWTSAWASLPSAIFPWGTSTAQVSPARAA